MADLFLYALDAYKANLSTSICRDNLSVFALKRIIKTGGSIVTDVPALLVIFAVLRLRYD